MVEHVATARSIRNNPWIANITFVLPCKVPLAMRPNESSHGFVDDDGKAIYSRNCYFCMCIDDRFPVLQKWWLKWTSVDIYPDSIELLREVYPDCKVESGGVKFKVVLEKIRLSRKPLPLLWSTMTQLLIPYYYRLLVNKSL